MSPNLQGFLFGLQIGAFGVLPSIFIVHLTQFICSKIRSKQNSLRIEGYLFALNIPISIISILLAVSLPGLLARQYISKPSEETKIAPICPQMSLAPDCNPTSGFVLQDTATLELGLFIGAVSMIFIWCYLVWIRPYNRRRIP